MPDLTKLSLSDIVAALKRSGYTDDMTDVDVSATFLRMFDSVDNGRGAVYQLKMVDEYAKVYIMIDANNQLIGEY